MRRSRVRLRYRLYAFLSGAVASRPSSRAWKVSRISSAASCPAAAGKPSMYAAKRAWRGKARQFEIKCSFTDPIVLEIRWTVERDLDYLCAMPPGTDAILPLHVTAQ